MCFSQLRVLLFSPLLVLSVLIAECFNHVQVLQADGQPSLVQVVLLSNTYQLHAFSEDLFYSLLKIKG